MSADALKRVGIACFVLSAVLLIIGVFAAVKRSQENAAKVGAGSEMMRSSSPSGMYAGITEGDEAKPRVPVTTKCSLALAVIASVGGIVCFVLVSKKTGKVKKAKRAKQTEGGPQSLKPRKRSS